MTYAAAAPRQSYLGQSPLGEFHREVEWRVGDDPAGTPRWRDVWSLTDEAADLEAGAIIMDIGGDDPWLDRPHAGFDDGALFARAIGKSRIVASKRIAFRKGENEAWSGHGEREFNGRPSN